MGLVQVRSVLVERVLKSFAFSALLFVVWGWAAFQKGKGLLSRFDAVEMAFFFYNAAIAVLFLIRTQPSIVSMDPLHWLVALATSFSGFFFRKYDVDAGGVLFRLGDVLIVIGLVIDFVVLISLGRSYDFLPALRGVQTGWAYRMVRHPMYVFAIVIRLGYLFRHPSLYNLTIFPIMLWLYLLRCRFEESVMEQDPRYRAYLARVRWRLLPGVY